jgi:hypothetical protein
MPSKKETAGKGEIILEPAVSFALWFQKDKEKKAT